jgi:hypothetical protein
MTDVEMPVGPLKVCSDNPRYLATPDGRAVYLTGSHTWACLQDRLLPETPIFDYSVWLDMMEQCGHNFLRLWVWEQAAWMQFTERKVKYGPNRYKRTGPGEALDGGPKFDLTQFNEDYFDRLRSRVVAAGKRGIYVGVMMFQGFSLDKRLKKPGGNAFDGHPMNAANNINGIDGDSDGDETGFGVHRLDVPEVTKLQEAYVARVIDALNDLDHVVWEISNESRTDSVEWHYHLIDFIHSYESKKPKQHVVGMTGSPIPNEPLYESAAEWISPRGKEYRSDPPEADGSKVIIFDTDHTGHANANPKCPWRCMARGMSFIAMDYYMDARPGSPSAPMPEWDEIRIQMGYARRYAERMDLNRAVPRSGLSSSGFCLAEEGTSYLVYLPDGGDVKVDLSGGTGTFKAEWFSPRKGEVVGECEVEPSMVEMTTPFEGDAVLFLESVVSSLDSRFRGNDTRRERE